MSNDDFLWLPEPVGEGMRVVFDRLRAFLLIYRMQVSRRGLLWYAAPTAPPELPGDLRPVATLRRRQPDRHAKQI